MQGVHLTSNLHACAAILHQGIPYASKEPVAADGAADGNPALKNDGGFMARYVIGAHLP